MDQSSQLEVAISSPVKQHYAKCGSYCYGHICNALEMQGGTFNLIAEG